MAEKCIPMKKTQFFKVRNLPSKLEPNAFYIVENNGLDEHVDFYITDKFGNLKTIVTSGGIKLLEESILPATEESLVSYETDINPNDNYYYYGYEYIDRWEISRVVKDSVSDISTAKGTTAFSSNWNNRETLTYN